MDRFELEIEYDEKEGNYMPYAVARIHETGRWIKYKDCIKERKLNTPQNKYIITEKGKYILSRLKEDE